MKSKEKFCNLLQKHLEALVSDPQAVRAMMYNVCLKHKVSVSDISDIITLKKELIYENEYLLFCVSDVVMPTIVDEYFTVEEVAYYTNHNIDKMSTDKIEFDAIPIGNSNNHWVSCITVKRLMEFRDAQLINYNEQAQRLLKHIVNGGTEYFKIDINKSAVKKIKESFYTGMFIPNTITLNIPQETEFEYKNGKLIVKDIKSFDILDGYHRFVAMSDLYNGDPEFDYPMELRIVSFDLSTAKQFIYQEDQKTKMTKIASESLNQLNPGTQVTNMLNEGILVGIIGRNGAIIDAAVISRMIDLLYFTKNIYVTKSKIINVKNIIKENFERFLEEDPHIFDKPWDFRFTICAITGISLETNLEEIKEVYNIVSADKTIIPTKRIERYSLSRVRKLFKKGGN